MPHYDARDADCSILTFKEGLFAAAGHDLKLRVTDLSVDVDPVKRTVEATARASSIEVVAAMRDGREHPSSLSASDKERIQESLREVLDVERYPDVRLTARATEAVGDGFRVEGKLALHGREVPVAFVTRLEAGRQVGELTLHQPDAGIRPFKAAFGGLRVRADVKLVLAVPWPHAD